MTTTQSIMKKKNLTSLLLHKCSIANLTLLHKKIGGVAEPMTTEEQTYMDPNNVSIVIEQCATAYQSGAPDCPSFDEYTCQTNAGATKARPPSEHQACQAHTGQSAMHHGMG